MVGSGGTAAHIDEGDEMELVPALASSCAPAWSDPLSVRRHFKAHGAMPAWGEAFGDSGGGTDRTQARERLTQLTQFVVSIQRGTPLATPAPRSALCIFSNPGFSGRGTETADIREKLSPGDACEEILVCLSRAGCIETYCGATTLRGGWRWSQLARLSSSPDSRRPGAGG